MTSDIARFDEAFGRAFAGYPWHGRVRYRIDRDMCGGTKIGIAIEVMIDGKPERNGVQMPQDGDADAAFLRLREWADGLLPPS